MPPARPAAYAEEALVAAILDGTYPLGSNLPSERDLAVTLGVTRPTLREALQRLSRDGWLLIRQGKPTQVNDFWRSGGLNVLSGLVRHEAHLPANFIPNLLAVRLDLAPSYAREAVRHNAAAVAEYLDGRTGLADDPAALASFDWGLHRHLAGCAENPIYTLILNGFGGFYEAMARRYFAAAPARAASLAFYAALHVAAAQEAPAEAERVTRAAIEASIALWESVDSHQ
jgi:GntR family transcriptional regulator, negative regulator for fad regulon and positive regulator of fabA